MHGTFKRVTCISINSLSYIQLVKKLACIFAPMTEHTAYMVRNSTVFVERIQGLQATPQDTLLSFDVKNLFTCVLV